MGVSMASSDESKNVSLQASKELVDEFDKALKKAQIQGDIELDTSRSEAMRRLMIAAVEDPSLFGSIEKKN